MDDFLSGESGTVGRVDGWARRGLDAAEDALQLLTAQRLRLARAARGALPARRILALCVQRPQHETLVARIRAELERSRHRLDLRVGDAGSAGKFENLNALLAQDGNSYAQDGSPDAQDASSDAQNASSDAQDGSPDAQDGSSLAERFDWVLVIDDDIELPHGFLDRFVFLAERFSFDLAQPAHAHSSHAAWRVTRRRGLSVARRTEFVEIGPLTAFGRRTLQTLLPFPPLRMGWGLDAHWAALARERGWRCGVVDALPIRHRAAPSASAYSREQALSEAREFLRARPYVKAVELQRTLATYRTWR